MDSHLSLQENFEIFLYSFKLTEDSNSVRKQSSEVYIESLKSSGKFQSLS